MYQYIFQHATFVFTCITCSKKSCVQVFETTRRSTMWETWRWCCYSDRMETRSRNVLFFFSKNISSATSQKKKRSISISALFFPQWRRLRINGWKVNVSKLYRPWKVNTINRKRFDHNKQKLKPNRSSKGVLHYISFFLYVYMFRSSILCCPTILHCIICRCTNIRSRTAFCDWQFRVFFFFNTTRVHLRNKHFFHVRSGSTKNFALLSRHLCPVFLPSWVGIVRGLMVLGVSAHAPLRPPVLFAFESLTGNIIVPREMLRFSPLSLCWK